MLVALLVACGQSDTPATTGDAGGAATTSAATAGESEMTAEGDSMAQMDHGDMGTDDDMSATLETLEGAKFEIAFIDAMIPHHQSAIEMAQIALERSQRPELQAAAQAIIAAQQAEIDQMTAWLQEWHGATPSDQDHGMAMTADIEALHTVPTEEFDIAFLEAMIPHHDGAIAMAELVPGRTERAELIELAEAILSAQRAENEQFEQWIAEWGGASE